MSEAPRTDGVLETALYVTDLARARDFYRELLGCAVLLDTPRLAALDVGERSVLLLFQEGATEDALHTPGGLIPGHGGRGIQHFALAIPREAVAAWVSRLEERGVAVESRVRWDRGGESIYFRDPDGNSVELVTPRTWATY
jgi:catechol 2,3-dioxygenase-like lactoylglutathione lyase family enzyme